MKVFYKRIIFSVIVVSLCQICFSQQISDGIKLFMENNPTAAIPVIEKELNVPNPNLELFNYLGIAYSQVGNFQKAVEVFEKGINTFGTNKKVLYFNQGNAYYRLQNFAKAVDCYAMSVVADSQYAQPYLNRANAYLKLNDIDNSILDYEKFLELKPNDVQEPKIRELLAALYQEKEIRVAEEKRKQEEALRLKEEEERLAKAKAEQERLAALKRAEEEERRRKLLEEVAASLKQSSDTTNMSAGAEDVFNYSEESEID